MSPLTILQADAHYPYQLRHRLRGDTPARDGPGQLQFVGLVQGGLVLIRAPPRQHNSAAHDQAALAYRLRAPKRVADSEL